jgi:hypothetical protein
VIGFGGAELLIELGRALKDDVPALLQRGHEQQERDLMASAGEGDEDAAVWRRKVPPPKRGENARGKRGHGN